MLPAWRGGGAPGRGGGGPGVWRAAPPRGAGARAPGGGAGPWAAAAEPDVELRPATHVTGLLLDSGRVRAVVTDAGTFAADVVVDALGRRTPTFDWLASAGVEAPAPATSDCGVVYYSRYYRQRP